MYVYPPAFFDDREYRLDATLCFVIMPFSASWSAPVYDRIAATVAECGYRCRRADEFHGHVVLADIWRGVSEAAFVIADLTDHNPNVFYELGLVHLLGKELIPLLQDGQSLPFDQLPFRTLTYDPSQPGRDLLHDRLTQWIADLSFSAVPELMLRRGAVAEFNRWRRAHALRPLVREDFAGGALAGVDFRGANLAETTFIQADLSGANCSRASFIRSSLQGAQLTNADLSYANLSEANLIGARMSHADMTGVIMLRPELSGADLGGVKVDRLTIDFASHQRFEALFAACRGLETMIVER